MRDYTEVTEYVMHMSSNERLFIDFENERIARYFIDEMYLHVEIDGESVDFQAETQETRDFIKEHFNIKL